MKDMTAETVSRLLVHNILLRYRAVRGILTDQGRQFQGKLLKAICQLFDVKQLRTTAYHPQTNGLTERLNGTLVRLLAKACRAAAEGPHNWDDLLPHIVRAYNTTPHRMTGESPFYLLFGDDPESPFELSSLFPTYDPLHPGIKRVNEIQTQLAERRHWAIKVWEAGEAEDYRRFTHAHTAELFHTGDTVWLDTRQIPARNADPKHVLKLRKKFTGPFIVVDVKSANVVSVRPKEAVQTIQGGALRLRSSVMVVSTARLKKQLPANCGSAPVVT
jgi:hypothetical protein